ncbi:MAG: NTP transferase domain-containing protein [Parcubacteria group bacterium]|nr:NTP transferase domain-containing protein [Parcubacteria group bacterium]
MQAVILAAGEGKRLRPLTDHVPKPMVRIAGKPILEHTIRALPKEIDEVILVIGYKGEVVQSYFGDSFEGRTITYVWQEAPKGTMHALALAKDILKDDLFLALYADDLYDPIDIANCMQTVPVILVKETVHPERFGVCLVGEKGRLISIFEKHENPPSNLAFIGAHLLDKSIFNVQSLPMPNGEINLTKQIGVWAEQRHIQVIRAHFWHPIGYPEDVESAERLLAEKMP